MKKEGTYLSDCWAKLLGLFRFVPILPKQACNLLGIGALLGRGEEFKNII